MHYIKRRYFSLFSSSFNQMKMNSFSWVLSASKSSAYRLKTHKHTICVCILQNATKHTRWAHRILTGLTQYCFSFSCEQKMCSNDDNCFIERRKKKHHKVSASSPCIYFDLIFISPIWFTSKERQPLFISKLFHWQWMYANLTKCHIFNQHLWILRRR